MTTPQSTTLVPPPIGILPALAQKLFGPSWRTSLGGFGAIAATVGGILSQIPVDQWPHPKVWLPLVLGSLAAGYMAHNMKDKQVSGNGTPDNPTSTAVSTGNPAIPTVSRAVLVVLLCSALPFLGTGCASVSADEAKISAFLDTPQAKAAGQALLT